jgi:hypothetical protein
MSLVFFLARMLSMPFYYYRIYEIYGTERYLELGGVHYCLVHSCIILDIVNIFWFYKLALGCIKVIKGLVKKDSGNANHEPKKE